jgi:capsid portal protein
MKTFAFLLALILAAFRPAIASAPVHKTIVGCVLSRVFKSENGYIIKIRRRSGRPMNLARWQHKRLRVVGDLLPGDNFYLTDAPTDLGNCR